MATTEPMDLDAMQQEIHALFANGIDTPAPTDDDYKLRTALCNKFIGDWERTDYISWVELLDVQSDGIYTIADPTLNLNSDFKQIGGKVWIAGGGVGQRFNVPFLSQARLDDDIMPPTYCYVTGPTGAKVLNFVGVDPMYDGGQITLRYQRFANLLSDPEDVPDMSDPRFIISSVVARLFQLGRNNTGYTINFNDAQNYMSSMKAANRARAPQEKELPVGYRINNFGVMGQ